MTDRISHRAAVEAGYASLAEYIDKWGEDMDPTAGHADLKTLEYIVSLQDALKECARPFKGTLPDWESAARALAEELQRRVDVAISALRQEKGDDQ